MSDAHTHLLTLVFACIFFGYATVNSLVFYRRARHPGKLRNKALDHFVRSPRYGRTVWLSGLIGVVGFTIASWKLVLALWHMLHASS